MTARRAPRHIATLLLALTGASLVAPLGGCTDEFGRPIKGESIFDFLQPISPQQAAIWAADPFEPDKRYRGVLLLSNAQFGGEKVYVDMYRLAAEDGDPGVRAVALAALARHGTADDAPLVVKHTTDEAEEVRWHACRALQRIYYPEGVPALLERIKPDVESSVQVRASAARALGQYQQRRVAQGLVAALGERNLAVNENALESLRILTGQNHGYDEKKWLTWLSDTQDPFAGAVAYTYPVFERDKDLGEIILFFTPGPPNEVQGPVIGAPIAAATPAPKPQPGPGPHEEPPMEEGSEPPAPRAEPQKGG